MCECAVAAERAIFVCAGVACEGTCTATPRARANTPRVRAWAVAHMAVVACTSSAAPLARAGDPRILRAGALQLTKRPARKAQPTNHAAFNGHGSGPFRN